MGFLNLQPDDPTTKSDTTPSEFDTKQARKLAYAIKSKRKLMRRFHIKSWADEFRKLRQLDGVSKQRIKSALKWYVANIGGEYTPQAFSAHAFRAKFAQIEAGSKRQWKGKQEVSIEPLAQEILETLSQLRWPKSSKDQLPEVVQTSLNNFREFAKGLAILLDDPLANHLLGHLGTPRSFLERWFRKVHADVANWTDWNGNLQPYVFSRQSKRLYGLGMQLVSQYTNRPNAWKELMERVYGDHKT